METETITQDGKAGLFKSALDQSPDHPFFAREGVDPLTHAFDKKIAVHAGFGGRPLPKAEQGPELDRLLAQTRQKRSAVYIHVPFCESHCLYCGFYSRAYRDGESGRFTDTLLREIDLWRERPAVQEGPVHAVYIGGGTPTTLEPEDMHRLLACVHEVFPLANDCEITVEGRIHNFGTDKMAACLDGGANRFSIGVQTFHTELRRSMGRIADREAVIQSLDRLRDFDRAVVVIDLIYGFPGQTADMWRDDIKTFLVLDIDGADFYQLNTFQNSPLRKAVDAGKFPPPADLPGQAHMFALGERIMERARYRRLSMSHWGRTTRERNIYNHLMKGPSECLAFGPGAGGCLGGHYYFVNNDYKTWLSSIDAGEKPISILVGPRPLAQIDKTLAAAFDLGRLDLDRLGASPPNAVCNQTAFDEARMREMPREILRPVLEQWRRAGLLEIEDGWIELTTPGRFWHVNLAQLAIDYLHRWFEKEEIK